MGASLPPGAQYDWHYEWCAANIGGNYPIVDCTEDMVVAEPLHLRRVDEEVRVTARLGIFRGGRLRVMFLDGQKHLIPGKMQQKVSPFEGVHLDAQEKVPAKAEQLVLLLENDLGEIVAELARGKIGKR